jgi:hypothetical protein
MSDAKTVDNSTIASIDGTVIVKDPRTEAITTLLNYLLKDVLFEVVYKNNTKEILSFNPAMEAIFRADIVSVKPLLTEASKLLYEKKE